MGIGLSDNYNADKEIRLHNAIKNGLVPNTRPGYILNNHASLDIYKSAKASMAAIFTAIALAHTAYALDSDELGANDTLNVSEYIPMFDNHSSNNTSIANYTPDTQEIKTEPVITQQTSIEVTTSSAPPTPGGFFDIYGNILNGTDWGEGSILNANVSMLFYNQSTGEVAAVMQSQVGNTEENPQYIIRGVNKSIVLEGDIATVEFDGSDGLINGSKNWTVVYPTEGSDSIAMPITYISPTPDPKIEDFAVSLFALGNDTKTNDANVIANRSGADSNYILQIINALNKFYYLLIFWVYFF